MKLAHWYPLNHNLVEKQGALVLGRFAQADSVVPPGNPQAWDRFAFANNNPLKYTDPSGHRTCTAAQAATGDKTCNQNYRADDLIASFFHQYDRVVDGEWSDY